MSQRIKNILRIVFFLTTLAICLLWVQEIVTPNRDWPSTHWRVKKTISGLLNEEAGSLDVLWVGTSHVAQGVSPMEIYRQTGLYTHQICGPEQRVAAQYYLIREALKRQKPRVVAIDASGFFYTEKQNQFKTRWQEAIDALPISSVLSRLEMASDYAGMKGESIFDGDYIEMAVLPILLYHTEYRVTEEEYLDRHLEQLYHRKGFVATSTVRSAASEDNDEIEEQFDEEEYEPADEISVDSLSVNIPYIERLVKLCRSKGCEVLFLKIPVHALDSYRGHWSADKHALVQELADDLEVPFLDLNYEDVGVNWNHDSSDGGKHLNVSGATTVSRFLSGWLLENYEFKDHQDDANKAKWDRQLELYDWEMEYYKQCMMYDVSTYLDQINKEDYTLLIRNSSPVGDWWTEELRDKFIKLTGCDLDISKKKNGALVLEVAGNEVVASASGKSGVHLEGLLEGNVNYSMDSGAGKGGAKGWIEVGGTQVKADDGIQIVVYDNNLHCVVDCALIREKRGKVGMRHMFSSFIRQYRLRVMDHVYGVMATL